MREEERSYRVFGALEGGIHSFRVRIETTDLLVRALGDLSEEAYRAAAAIRKAVAEHGAERPEFLTSFSPVAEPEGELHPVVAAMYRAAETADVGPMAAVAGAVAEGVARALLPLSPYVAVENGGDTFIFSEREVTVGLFAGNSPFTNKLGLVFDPCPGGFSVCTSSATVGPSISFGVADAATVVSASGALADAAASALGNRVTRAEAIEAALNHTLSIDGVTGALAVVGDRLGCGGAIRLIRLYNEGVP